MLNIQVIDGKECHVNPNGSVVEIKKVETVDKKKNDSVGYSFLFPDTKEYYGWLLFNGLAQLTLDDIEDKWK